jgi:tripartite-type tricarboxylate transporter receptor subunit TctC
MFTNQSVLSSIFAVLSTLALTATAQTYPTKQVRIIVGYTAGGAVDLIARTVGQQLQASLGVPVIIENKPGASTNIANRALIDSAPDGATVMLAANALAANQSLFQPAPYDLAKDVTPLALVGRVPVVLAVSAASPISNLQAFLTLAKQTAGGALYGSPGNGSTPHMAVELFERAAGVTLKHVPYKGGAQAITDVLGGHIQAVAVNALEVQPHVKSGKLRVIAVMTPQRASIFPDVPTVAESGFAGFEASVWYGFIAPAGLPAALQTTLHAAIQKALTTDEVQNRLRNAGGEVLPGSAASFALMLNNERLRYEKLVRKPTATLNRGARSCAHR